MKAVSVVSNPRLNTPPRSNYDEEYFVVEEVYYEDNCDDHNCDEDYYLIDNKPTTPNSKTGNNSTNSALSSLSQTKTNVPGKVAIEDNRYYNVCAICMNTIEPAKKAQIDNCKHEFCCECIEAWSKTKLSCPLCTLTFNKLLVNFSADGKSYEEKNITIAPKGISTSISDDLQCLDHTYFLQEINRLLTDTETMQRQLARQSQSRLKNTWESTKSNVLQNLVSTLRIYRESFVNYCSFEPELMLRELYDLQDELSQLRKGPNAISLISKARSQSASANTTMRYSADDADDCFDDDDFLEDINRMHIKKKPNSQRTPANNNNNKKKQQKIKSTKK